MFREHIQKVVDRLDGCVGGVLMGFDGITVESYAANPSGSGQPDAQTVAMEFAHLIAQSRRGARSLDAGGVREVTIRTDALTLVVHVLNEEYFLACVISSQGNLGKARYLLRLAAPSLRSNL
jgi:predicted regulator of Ras-like GTPase activity (Roadblock/LC7/MglB family)